MRKVLIIGKLPPPVGGVTVHVKRLIARLWTKRIPFTFCNLQNDAISTIVWKVFTHDLIHIHFSRPVLQLAFALFCRVTFKKVIITYHGHWGRYNWLGNFAVKLSARLASAPVVQDEASFRGAVLCNRRARLVSTFISSADIEPLPPRLFREIINRKAQHGNTFCTSAWNITFDKHGKETYGISDLVTLFKKHPQYLLLISDPSRNYRRYLMKNHAQLPENIMFISVDHDFRSILKLSDAFIRNTTTDGVSLSIHEARELRVPVLASNAVDRPAFCSLFANISDVDLQAGLAEGRTLLSAHAAYQPVTCVVDQIIGIYKNFQLG
ncbi:glycosyltransferase [Dyadobacter sp. MSC1_007]|jgi:glycosyltransferase involved in cell wall biosynthesis|uniref:glycosyltransferase n=1 Tax=Dyadobacter sp. MSC1_007 TaxID=2909264 RepID=UPI00203083CF|nr:glycosyltransferase [Dyadobacter sp. MSC1_007]